MSQNEDGPVPLEQLFHSVKLFLLEGHTDSEVAVFLDDLVAYAKDRGIKL